MVKSQTFDLDFIFQALSDPTRRSILKKLSIRERAISEIAESFSMSLASVSKHIKNLERAKLIRRRWEGSYSYVSLNPEAMSSADKWMSDYRVYWENQLSSLKNFIEEDNHES